MVDPLFLRPLPGGRSPANNSAYKVTPMRCMTLSNTKFHRRTATLLLLLGLAATPLATAFAADPPTAQLAAAARAVAAAERAQARGDAAPALDEARQKLAQAEELSARRKYRDAAILAAEAEAAADLALATAKLANARLQIEEKQARNADLQRELLVQPEAQP